ncbi:hypothetical protein EDB81DRAFT_846110 [Dactylonectria macrodidyma]|uniref:Uncharacterized protein n=1 Tax=Dactylonectria macrodidyma TaxID=307937 RepID=A0A9P9E1S9_9HYPO|nr:hypothetical protein EDB81DRAFT_846110 [Dactylonectria macrodidyma]
MKNLMIDGLDDTSFIVDIAENHDLIINTRFGFHPDAAEAFMRGLACRTPDHTMPWFVYLSGPCPQRTTEIAVLTAGEETGVLTISVNSLCIFGTVMGLFSREGFIIPEFLRYVHVKDLADLFVSLALAVITREDHGTPKNKEICQVALQEIADKIMNDFIGMAERSWAGHKRFETTMAREVFGWNPTRPDEFWKQNLMADMNALKSGNGGSVLELCFCVLCQLATQRQLHGTTNLSYRNSF